MIGFGIVAGAISGADGGPEAGVIKVTDAHARVAGRGGMGAVARGQIFIRGHLPRGGKLDGGREIPSGVVEDVVEGVENGGQADFGVTISGRDGGFGALRTRKEATVDAFGEGFEIGVIEGAERVQILVRGSIARDRLTESVGAGGAADLY